MTPAQRNRLVGSMIVIVAGIIILPSIFDGEKISYKDEFKTVPQRPEFEAVQNDKKFPQRQFDQQMPDTTAVVVDEKPLDAAQIAAQNRPDAGTDASGTVVLDNDTIAVTTIRKPLDFDKTPVLKPNPAVRNPIKSKAEKPKPKQSPFTSSAWVIQLGSFGLKANADALERKLNKAGYVTYSRQIKTATRTLTKVFVGPELDKAKLTKALNKVNALAGVKGIITPFEVKR